MTVACKVIWLGRREYRQVRECQRRLADLRHQGAIPDMLLLLEHPATLTLGRKTPPEHLLASSATLDYLDIAIEESDRGGDITYHGPGQLVGYPILHLDAPPHTPDLHRYLRDLEETLIRALASFEVTAARFPPHTGVWTGVDTSAPEKIAAIGIKASRWVTQHGFALNICPDLTHFQLIVPCGIREFGVTSLERLLGREVTVREALPAVVSAFAKVFRLECLPMEDLSESTLL